MLRTPYLEFKTAELELVDFKHKEDEPEFCYLCGVYVAPSETPQSVAYIRVGVREYGHLVCDGCVTAKTPKEYQEFVSDYLRLHLAEEQREALGDYIALRNLEGKRRHPDTKAWLFKTQRNLETARERFKRYKGVYFWIYHFQER